MLPPRAGLKSSAREEKPASRPVFNIPTRFDLQRPGVVEGASSCFVSPMLTGNLLCAIIYVVGAGCSAPHFISTSHALALHPQPDSRFSPVPASSPRSKGGTTWIP